MVVIYLEIIDSIESVHFEKELSNAILIDIHYHNSGFCFEEDSFFMESWYF